MSKLSTHQIRAMIAGIERTIGSHEARPGTARNVAALTRSQARLDSYRAELAEREAAEHAQDAEQETSQAGPDDSPAAPPADPLPTVHTPPKHQPIVATRDEWRAKHPHPPAEPIRSDTDDELRSVCTSLLRRWTLGTLLDQLWESEAKLFGTLTQPRLTRGKKAGAA